MVKIIKLLTKKEKTKVFYNYFLKIRVTFEDQSKVQYIPFVHDEIKKSRYVNYEISKP